MSYYSLEFPFDYSTNYIDDSKDKDDTNITTSKTESNANSNNNDNNSDDSVTKTDSISEVKKWEQQQWPTQVKRATTVPRLPKKPSMSKIYVAFGNLGGKGIRTHLSYFSLQKPSISNELYRFANGSFKSIYDMNGKALNTAKVNSKTAATQAMACSFNCQIENPTKWIQNANGVVNVLSVVFAFEFGHVWVCLTLLGCVWSYLVVIFRKIWIVGKGWNSTYETFKFVCVSRFVGS